MVKRSLPAILSFLLLLTPLTAEAFLDFLNPSPVKVEGVGWVSNFRLQRSLTILEDDPENPRDRFDNTYLEDAMWVLDGEIKSMGYLRPSFSVRAFRDGEPLIEADWSGLFQPPLPLDLDADRIVFSVEPGLMYYFDTLDAEGVTSLTSGELSHFFYPGGFLFVSRTDRYFTPGRLNSGLGNLVQFYRQEGYRDARIVTQSFTQNDETGAVDVHFKLDRGPRYQVTSLTVVEASAEPAGQPRIRSESVFHDQPYTNGWIEDVIRQWRSGYYRSGHPDVTFTQTVSRLEESEDEVTVAIRLSINPGPLVRVGDVRVDDQDKIRPGILRQQLRIKSGDLLDRQRVQDGRDRLARLGIFERVGVDYEIGDEGTWDVIYRTRLKPPYTVSLIFGVGSYDIVRGGFELEQNNIFGLGHRARLLAIQSLKSTSVNYRYLVPQLFGTDLNGYAQVNYLLREEISFEREEIGGSVGLEYYLPRWQTYLSAQYNFQDLQARRENIPVQFGLNKATVTSIQLNAQHSELDNPIYPTRGYRVQGTAEFAAPELGGDVGYQRIELVGAYHHPINQGLGFHFGFRHGLINPDGPVALNIPIGKRFFPGGENTVRGYRQGGAGSKDQSGTVVGSQTYMLFNVEFEQRLTSLFSVVAFVDTVGIGTTLNDYPFNQVLVSVGGGISIRTLVGPLRFEYGQNINPRPTDPQGTFQVALGFPF